MVTLSLSEQASANLSNLNAALKIYSNLNEKLSLNKISQSEYDLTLKALDKVFNDLSKNFLHSISSIN